MKHFFLEAVLTLFVSIFSSCVLAASAAPVFITCSDRSCEAIYEELIGMGWGDGEVGFVVDGCSNTTDAFRHLYPNCLSCTEIRYRELLGLGLTREEVDQLLDALRNMRGTCNCPIPPPRPVFRQLEHGE